MTVANARPNLNMIGRLKAKGLDASGAAVANLALDDIMVELDGVTAHPRWNDPLEEPFVLHIMQKGMFDPDTQEAWRLITKERGVVNGKLREELIDGARRLKHGLEAQRRLREIAPRQAPLQPDKDNPTGPGHLKVQISPFVGDDAELLYARLAANNRPRAKPDSVHVLAITIGQLATAGHVNADDIRARGCPPGTTVAQVEALQRWGNLTVAAKALYIKSNAPLALLPAVLDAPDSEQLARLEGFLANNITTTGQVARKLRKERVANGEQKPKPWSGSRLAAFANLITPASDEAKGFLAGLLFRSDYDVETLPDCVRGAAQAVQATKPKRGRPKQIQ